MKGRLGSGSLPNFIEPFLAAQLTLTPGIIWGAELMQRVPCRNCRRRSRIDLEKELLATIRHYCYWNATSAARCVMLNL